MKAIMYAAGLAAAFSLSSAAWADPIPNLIQSFSVHYADHGSSGPQDFDLYSGPFHLAAVQIAWAGAVSSGYGDPGEDPTPYTQDYSGKVGFFTSEGASDFVSFSGSTQCSFESCDVGASASRTLFLNPALFAGEGTGTIDCACDISPNFLGHPEVSGFDFEVHGTITYMFSPAPEPDTWAMMLGGFSLVGGAMRGRRKVMVRFS